ncbi:uncharacterized protein SAPINGB_P000002 [Magnusiomyces paraingens]|uniref:Uncharacterized protein n=1 Tax=Magnusiomyces paraingens TaxID=2606893 RepID=A0A5E8B266_9ASCO|nr:uncharacterized protein SAPINGB_P000002 [Saprochaete ingens]VVT43475.1 unnamed protein product [Saprochaete ingens]
MNEERRLKGALWHTVCQIVNDETNALEIPQISPEYTAALTELVIQQLITIGSDIEAFAVDLRKKKTITMEDIFLLTRRNKDLQNELGKLSTLKTL